MYQDSDGNLLTEDELYEAFTSDIPTLREYYGNDDDVTFEAWLGEMVLNGHLWKVEKEDGEG